MAFATRATRDVSENTEVHVRAAERADPDHRVHDALRAYHGHYYRDVLGLRDWERRVTDRLDEERLIGERVVGQVEEWFGCEFAGMRVLVVGTGTGAEFFTLKHRGALVCGVDVSRDAVSIVHLKGRVSGRSTAAVVAAAEALPFPTDWFDFVYCYTVLEHVADVEIAIDEMIRVCRVGGFVFIQTPDYTFPFENHYKLPLIPFAPRFVQSLYLWLRGRPPRFLKSINFLTVAKLNRLFWRRNVTTLRASEPQVMEWRANGNWVMAWWADTFAVQKHQNILLKKRPDITLDRAGA